MGICTAHRAGSLLVSTWSPHVYQGMPGYARGRYKVEILDNPEGDRWYVPFDAAAVQMVACYWAVVDDYGRLIRVGEAE